ncbi:hypothetical protein Goarm_010691, partial [Gossypium armourianum]|nr:hypothetical protein [Gossypium armourianum]
VLYRFLEFFSKFDWENFCVSLWGPVPIRSLPDITAEPPRRDGGDLLLSKYFLDTCSSRYAVCQENQGQPFVSKYFNVIDPLRLNNNLGRSVSKGNFFRIRSAFSFGAKKLARLLDCPKGDLYYEVNQFFMNTWERHGCGQRPDAPRNDLWPLRFSNSDHTRGSKNVRNNSSSKGNHISSGHETEAEEVQVSCGVPSHNHPSESTVSDVSTVFHSQRSYGSMSNSKTSDQVRRNCNSNQNVHNDTGQRNSKAEKLVTDVQGRYIFARTRSSPELTETYEEATSQGRRNRMQESGEKTQIGSMRSDNRRNNMGSVMVASYNIKSCDDPSSTRQTSTRQSIAAASDPNSLLNGNQDDLGLGTMAQDFSSIPGSQGMHQEEQDLVNMIASSTTHVFNGQVPVPLNLAAGHLPFSLQSLSTGYNQRNLGGIVPANIQMFPHGLVSPPLAHYISGIELPSNAENSVEPSSGNFGSSEMNPGEVEHELHHEHDRGSVGGFDLDNGNFEIRPSDDNQLSTSAGYEAGSSGQKASKSAREKRGRKTAASVLHFAACGKGKSVSERSSQADDDGRDWNPPSIGGTEMVERTIGPQPVGSFPVPKHQMPGEEAQTSGPDSPIPIAPFLLGPGSGQRTMDNSGVPPLAFTITGPPVPFLFCPVYNIPAETGTPEASAGHFSWDEGLDNNDSGKTFESSEGLDHSEVLSTSMRKVSSLDPSEHKSDILNSDIASHWQNLLYGRFCENLRYPPNSLYPSPVVVPPIYLQGHFPWDGPGRPLSYDMNLFSQLMNYGPHVLPVAPLQS